ncbi:MAG: hypothetical protein ABIV11_01205 [Gemmatimonadaceae bacterium]
MITLRLPSVLLAAAVVACAPLPRYAEPADCGPTRATLPRDATAAGLGGHYNLVFVATEGERRGRVERGRMVLLPRDSAGAIIYTLRREPHPNAREPYFGTAEIALDSLGAYTRGTLSSTDPRQPGIAIREFHWDRAEDPTSIQLIVGSGTTRRDVFTLDGPYVDIQIRELTPGGFRGVWEASLGHTSYRAAGFFCAARVG